VEQSVQEIVDRFHDLYYNGKPGEGFIFQRTSWFGVPTAKCPMDMWIYQEILTDLRPDIIIECGTFMGGSALYFAHLFDNLGSGRIITIDIEEREGRPEHPHIAYLTGSSTDPDIFDQVTAAIPSGSKVMVILDSDHSYAHVSKELELYSPLVSQGQYLVVEDTNVNGHPTYAEFGPGPWEAAHDFMRSNDDFVVDKGREKFLMTFNPSGYLLRQSTGNGAKA
jgi:cephalosporin hydroxylase